MDDDMKLCVKTIKELRNEHAWSQEQLAEIADLSLRTIQRVEADGSASLETRKALAAAFDVTVPMLMQAELKAEGTLQTAAAQLVPPLPGTYRIALLFALLAAAVVTAALQWPRLLSTSIASTALMVAISSGLYGGFGWYFSGPGKPATPARRTLQFGLIFSAIALLFTSLSAAPREMALIFLQMMVLASAIYFSFDWYFSRQRRH